MKRRCTMLFHVTMTHTPDNCPGYWPPEKQAELLEKVFLPDMERSREISEKFEVTIQTRLLEVAADEFF